MDLITALPKYYQVAIHLGARVEVLVKGKWTNLFELVELESNILRIKKEDIWLEKEIDSFINKTHSKVYINDEEYLLPKSGVNIGEVVCFIYKKSIFKKINEKGEFEDLKEEEIKKHKTEQDFIISFSRNHFYNC